jgi:digeranylgeranylglycerophospholipid reductase
MILKADVVVVGGGPGGLSAAESVAKRGLHTIVLEQSAEIGSPTRTSGGSFIKELQDLGIPETLYHPIKSCRFISPNNSVTFEYDNPALCVMDVRNVFQFLAGKAVEAGAKIRVNTSAVEPILENNYVIGVKAKCFRGKEFIIRSRIIIDATGYRASMIKKLGPYPVFERFGVGAEYDLHAPFYNQNEVVLIVGSQIAPAGYAWAFPWGNNRVRVGVGIIHTDSSANPNNYLEKLIHESSKFGFNLDGAEPIEYHFGLIPSEGLCERFVGNGIMAVGDAAGQPSAVAGEGIRWAIKAGRMAGEIASEAISANNCSLKFLAKYEQQWKTKYGTNLSIAHKINKTIAGWTDEEWDQGVKLLKVLTPDQFLQALKANFIAGWTLEVLSKKPRLIKKGAKKLMEKLFADLLQQKNRKKIRGRISTIDK